MSGGVVFGREKENGMKFLTVSIHLLLLLIFSSMIRGFREPALSEPMRFKPPPLPAEVSFCGEPAPIDDPFIREQLDREVLYNYYLPNNILYIIKLSRRYFPMIGERLKANGVPDDMKYLCVAESNLQPLVSKAGAAGFWQFMPATATGMGMRINSEVDERYNIEKATDAACAYLKDAYRRLGSWTLAAAAYNCGPGRVANAKTQQGTSDYYEMLLPEETNRYMFRILTFKYFIESADELGFDVPAEDGYLPLQLERHTVSSSIPNLAAYASARGSNLRELKAYNPWVKGNRLTVSSGRGYTLLLPKTSVITKQ